MWPQDSQLGQGYWSWQQLYLIGFSLCIMTHFANKIAVSSLGQQIIDKSLILLKTYQLFTKPVDNSVDCGLIRFLYDGFYYSFVKLYKNQPINFYTYLSNT